MSGNIVQVKEKYGNTINATPIHYKGETLYAPVIFGGMNDVIGNIDDFKSRPDDVWISSYPKSGNTYYLSKITYVSM